eukprot:14980868-Heterocapsa_arctica.AAC.1
MTVVHDGLLVPRHHAVRVGPGLAVLPVPFAARAHYPLLLLIGQRRQVLSVDVQVPVFGRAGHRLL